MDTLEKLVKAAVLFVFCLLNVIDMIQTMEFLNIGIEGNIFVVSNPQLWFTLKIAFAFGLPSGLYYLDTYIDSKEEDGFYESLDRLIDFVYVIVFLADIFYLQLVMKNTAILGRVLP